jgi:hypothetical protein
MASWQSEGAVPERLVSSPRLTDDAFVRTAVGVVLLVMSATQIGCGSGVGGGQQPGDGGGEARDCDGGCLTPADDVFITKFCTQIEACCATNGGAASRTPDVAACKRQFTANGFSRDSAVQSMCLAEVQGIASAGTTGCLPEIWSLSDACVRLFYEPSGSAAPGEPCKVRSDCAGEAGAVTLCFGQCVRMARGKAGDAICLGDMSADGVIIAAPGYQPAPLPTITTGVLCSVRDGLFCGFTGELARHACTPMRAGGEACDYSRTCISGRCYNGDNTAGGLTGTCDTVVPPGQTCNDDLARTVCDAASHCDGDGITPGHCVAGLPGGATCDADFVCANGACQNGICKSTTAAQDGAIFGYCWRTPRPGEYRVQ